MVRAHVRNQAEEDEQRYDPDEARLGVSHQRLLTVLWALLWHSQFQATGFAGGI